MFQADLNRSRVWGCILNRTLRSKIYRIDRMNKIARTIWIIGLLCMLAGCTSVTNSEPGSTSPSPKLTVMATPVPTQAHTLSSNEIASLNSLERMTEYPLYTMRYYGTYRQDIHAIENLEPGSILATTWPDWGCSLFAALGDGTDMFYGRNFDWRYSPALLLFTDPPDGYASAAMVDMDYLLPSSLRGEVTTLTELPTQERAFLLDAPAWPFDGMNDQGLVVGMAAVMDSRSLHDPAKPSIGSLEVIRQMLDHASNVDEAVSILETYNISMDGVPIHYLIADRTGRSVLVELDEKMTVIPNDFPWHLATNHLRVNVPPGAPSGCWRYDTMEQRLAATGGDLTSQQAIDLLQSVSQEGDYATQWSIVYGMDSGLIQIAMGREFESLARFHFDLVE